MNGTLQPARTARRAAMYLLGAIGMLALVAARSHAHPRPAIRHATSVVASASTPLSDSAESLHMEMSPTREATNADRARASAIAATLRSAIVKYADTSVAVADGYRLFLPQVKEQKVYHFTNSWRAVQEAMRFDPARPTSLLYKKNAVGDLVLVGAMYTAPKRFTPDKLDERVPLSVARWHKHVNWCMPKPGELKRWGEQRDGHPLFGPESPVATKAACDEIGGVFRENLFGWMVHANVFEGSDPAVIWGDEHAGQDMHAGMKMDTMP